MNLVELEKQLLKLEQQAVDYPWDPKAEVLLKVAENATASVLHCDLMGVLQRSVRRKGEDGDVMTVVWDISSAGLKGSLILEDTLVVSRYWLKLHDTSIEKLAVLLPEVLIWPYPMTSPLTIQRIEGHDSIIGQVEMRLSGAAAAWIHDFDIRGAGRRDGDWTIQLVVGKAKLRQFYGNTIWVPERVPPLTEIVLSWSDDKLASELSDRIMANDRDRIIMAEVVRRKPTDAYLLELVANAPKNQMTQLTRFGQIIGAFLDSDPSGLKARSFIEANIASFEAMGTVSEEVVREAYRFVGCSVSVEARAVRYLAEGRFANAAVAYFSRCSTSNEAYKALETARLPEQLESRRQDALGAFRSRIEGQTPAQRPSSIK